MLKEENQGGEPAIQEIACVTTVFKRVCGERWNLSDRTRDETLASIWFVFQFYLALYLHVLYFYFSFHRLS